MVPLQIPGTPGDGLLSGLSSTALLAVTIVLVIALVLIGWWVYRDAKKHDSRYAWLWGVGVPVLFIIETVLGLVGLVVYLLAVRR